jgi:hypothetical protein
MTKCLNYLKSETHLKFICKVSSYLTEDRLCFHYRDKLRAGRSEDRMLVWARFSAPVQTGPEAPPCTMGTGYFPGVKSGRDVTLTPHPLLVPLVMKE